MDTGWVSRGRSMALSVGICDKQQMICDTWSFIINIFCRCYSPHTNIFWFSIFLLKMNYFAVIDHKNVLYFKRRGINLIPCDLMWCKITTGPHAIICICCSWDWAGYSSHPSEIATVGGLLIIMSVRILLSCALICKVTLWDLPDQPWPPTGLNL